ncbi:MAG: transcription elongation factor GreA [Clostridia bacterium]|nr:transcription elongation factor GreA [Clostridia bacterium]
MAITVTLEGKLKLEEELNYLKNVKRKEVTEAIGIAKGFGDLSENSEYDEAKTEQAKVESRIAELEEMLKNIVVVSEVQTDVVGVGAKVRVYNEKWEEEVEYSIVGSTEADPLNNKISDLSPIGSAILGRKVGETVVVETPTGHVNITILEISV